MDDATPDLPPLVEAYLAYVRHEKRLAERTQTLYHLDLQRLTSLANDAGIELTAVQPHHIRRWVAQMHSAGRSGRGIALILSGWRGFYTWLGQKGDIPINPVLDVRAPKQAKPLPKALGVDEAMQLADFQKPNATPWTEARDAALVELLYGCGLRVGEIVGLNAVASQQAQNAGRGWIDLDNADVQVQGKGGKRRSVPLGGQAIAALRRWLTLRAEARKADSPDADALFLNARGGRLSAQGIWLLLRQRSQQAGLATPVHPHMLRHSFASHVLQSSGDLRAVQELLGHASIATTQVYTRLDFQHLAKTYDAAHPRAKKKS